MVRGLCLVTVFSLALAAAAPVRAADDEGEEVDFDRLDRADELVRQALAAAEAGEWADARRLAEEVMFIDDSYATAAARVVLVQALEREESYDSALYELRQYLALPLTDEERDAGARLQARLEARKTGTYRPPRRPWDRNARAGLGLVVGGTVPAVVGGIFLANDIHWSAVGVESGTWAAIGTPLLVLGLVVDIVGVVMLTRSRTLRAKVSDRGLQRPPSVRFSVAPSPEGMAFSLGLTW